MEVRIGVQHVAREITFETTLSADELVAAVKAAHDADVLELTDEKGGRIIVPTTRTGPTSPKGPTHLTRSTTPDNPGTRPGG